MTHLDDEDTPTSPGVPLGRPSMSRRSPEEALQVTTRAVDRLHMLAAWALLTLGLCGLLLLYRSGVL